MSHHIDQLPSELVDQLREAMGNPRLGATGRYPHGKLSPDDEGEIAIAVVADMDRRIVAIDLGKPTQWIGFTPEQASDLADMLTEKANRIRGII